MSKFTILEINEHWEPFQRNNWTATEYNGFEMEEHSFEKKSDALNFAVSLGYELVNRDAIHYNDNDVTLHYVFKREI